MLSMLSAALILITDFFFVGVLISGTTIPSSRWGSKFTRSIAGLCCFAAATILLFVTYLVLPDPSGLWGDVSFGGWLFLVIIFLTNFIV